MSKQQKKKVSEGDLAVKRRHKTKNRVAHQSTKIDLSDPAAKNTEAKKKYDACKDELDELAKTLPVMTKGVLLDNMEGIRMGKPIRLPSRMPFCDKADMKIKLEWYQHLWQKWIPLAEAVEKRYGRQA